MFLGLTAEELTAIKLSLRVATVATAASLPLGILVALALVVLLCPDERIGMVVSLPVLAIIGYWLAMCRNSIYGAGMSEPEPVLVSPIPAGPVVDTERGRMS